MRKIRKTWWAAVCGAVMLTVMSAGTALAEDESPKGQWINMEKGPGVAQWVDENGVVTDPPGVKQEEDGQSQEETEGSQEAQAGETAQEETGSQENQADQTANEGTQAASGRVIDPSRPMVALTFDDGPMASVGNRIMDCLAQYGGKATFYVVGNRCPGYAAEMQRMAAEGHEIGNHTYEHKYLHKLGAEQIQYQVNKGSEAIQAVCGVVPATVRLPGDRKSVV